MQMRNQYEDVLCVEWDHDLAVGQGRKLVILSSTFANEPDGGVPVRWSVATTTPLITMVYLSTWRDG